MEYKTHRIQELLDAANSVISNLEDAQETTDEDGQEFSDITKLKKAIADMNRKEKL